MPKSIESTAIVIDKSLRGEGDLLLSLFSAELGFFNCIKKISKKKTSQQPDFFNLITGNFEKIGASDLRILRDFELLKSNASIAKNYDAFMQASEICRTILKNGKLIEDVGLLYDTLTHALSALDAGANPIVVRTKFVYIFSKQEGYAVKQGFASNLNLQEKSLLQEMLSKPSLNCQVCSQEAQRLLAKFIAWLSANTDIVF